jgi:Uma2 family endonuclease
MRAKPTYADLRDMPEDGWRYELLEGDIVASPAPSWRHQRIVHKLDALLDRAESTGAGVAVTAPTDVVFDPDLNALQPDLLFIAREKLGHLVTETHVAGAPDLVVEVLSPGTAHRERGAKLRVYARYGVRLYWIVDPAEEAVHAHTLGPDGYGQPAILRGEDLLGCPLFPGVTLSVATLFTE